MTPEQYEEKIAQLEADVDDLNEEVDELNGTLRTMEDEKNALEARIVQLDEAKEALEERVTELEDTLKKEERDHEASLRVIEAVRTYLSWVDSPPPKMEAVEYERFRSAFRRDLDAALREVP